MKSGIRKVGLVALIGAIIGVGVYGCKKEEPQETSQPQVTVTERQPSTPYSSEVSLVLDHLVRRFEVTKKEINQSGKTELNIFNNSMNQTLDSLKSLKRGLEGFGVLLPYETKTLSEVDLKKYGTSILDSVEYWKYLGDSMKGFGYLESGKMHTDEIQLLAKEFYSNSLPNNAYLITKGSQRGFFVMENGDLFVPGLSFYMGALEGKINISSFKTVPFYFKSKYQAAIDHFLKAEYKLGIEEVNEILEQNLVAPNYLPKIYYNRGLSYEMMELNELAMRDYNKAIELGIDISSAYVRRGQLHIFEGSYEKAHNDFKKAYELEKDPNNLLDILPQIIASQMLMGEKSASLEKKLYEQSKIAFTGFRTRSSEIYVMNADGSEQKMLTYYSAGDLGPSWSPDGEKIVFASKRDRDFDSGDRNYEIYVMDRDGSNQTNLTNNPAKDEFPFWSPDGEKIVFASDRDGNSEIYVMNADGSEQKRLTNNPAVDGGPSWSPDGEKIVFASNRDGNGEIYVMNADGSEQKRLTNNPGVDGGPSWSPDGEKIVFASKRDRDFDSGGRNYEIYVMNADGSEQKRLTNNPAVDGCPSWSPDGEKITFHSNRDGNGEIYVMNADGTNQKRLTYNYTMDAYPSWSPFLPSEPKEEKKQVEKLEEKTTEPPKESPIIAPETSAEDSGSETPKKDDFTPIMFIPQLNDNGMSIIGVDWVLCSGHGETEPSNKFGEVEYNGKWYMRVQTPTNFIKRERAWLRGEDDALGLVYSVGKIRLFRKIDDIKLVKSKPAIKERPDNLEDIFSVHIYIEGEGYPLYHTLTQHPEMEKKYLWSRTKDGKKEFKYFHEKEKVPKEYWPYYTIRALGLRGYDGEDASPNINSVGDRILQGLGKSYWRICGLVLMNQENVVPNVGKVPIVLQKSPRGREIPMRVVIYYGNGDYECEPKDWDPEFPTGPYDRPLPVIIKEGFKKPLFFQPIEEDTWSYRPEKIVPFSFGSF